jgi:hypothetical protein
MTKIYPLRESKVLVLLNGTRKLALAWLQLRNSVEVKEKNLFKRSVVDSMKME